MNIWEGGLAYVVGPGIVGLGTVIAARQAARGSVQAAEVSSEPEQRNSAVDGYHQLVQDLQSDVVRLRRDHDDLRERHEVLNLHVKALEDQATRDKSLIRTLITYIKMLRNEIIALGGRIPEAPDGVDDKISIL